MDKIKVKSCFGRWGEINCNGLFNCGQYKKCSACYWKYYFKAKKRFQYPNFITKRFVLKFCANNNLELTARKKRRVKNEIV